MSYQENYEKLGTALTQMSDRLKNLLTEVDEAEVEDPAARSESSASGMSAFSKQETAAKIKELIESIQQEKDEGKLEVNDEFNGLLKELTDVVQAKDGTAAAKKAPPVQTVMSARTCVVCKRDDKPGQQRKSGFKCHDCIGKPSKIKQSNVTFDVMEITGTKSADAAGKKFIDDYDFGSNLGKGAFGKVKTCTHKKSGQVYAMKIVDRKRLERMRKPGAETSEFDKVMAEIKIMKTLQHPNVVRLYEVVDDVESGKVYLIMELCKGGRLFELNDEGFGDEPGMADTQPEKLKQCIVAIANGLDYLHNKHIYHRDLKPDNILIDDQGYCKLSDFGVSSKTNDDDTELKDTEGTPAFNSPEEFADNATVDGDKADIWSFGVTVFVAAFGYLPFMGSSIQEIGEAIMNQEVHYPEGSDELLVDLLKKFLVKDPTERITLQQVLEHRYVEDVRTVKGQAVETITCKIKSVKATELAGANVAQLGSIYECDTLLVDLKTGIKSAKAATKLCEYVNSKGGIYQVVLPTPDSCTLFRPRSLKRLAAQQEGASASLSRDARDVSFSFLTKESGMSSLAQKDSASDLLSNLGINF
jgi:[calcium/calmodulin-dependent protein kinase] kinase